jgi:hypothetical protein
VCDRALQLSLVSASALVALTLTASRAAAMSCIDHAYERMAIQLAEVRRDDDVVERPPELGDLDEVLNSGERGRWILLWNKATMHPAKFYALAEEATATPTVKRYIAAESERWLRTGCGYRVPYTPILPGRYVFQEEHAGGKTSRGIDEPVLYVRPGRGSLDLRFKIKGSSYRASYTVKCASFEWDKGSSCAPSEPSEPAAASPAPPPTSTAPAPRPDPSAVPVEPAPVRPGGCAACSAAAPGTPPVLGAALLLATLGWRGARAAARRDRRGWLPWRTRAQRAKRSAFTSPLP